MAAAVPGEREFSELEWLKRHSLTDPDVGKAQDLDELERMMRTPMSERGAPECKTIGKWLARHTQLPRIVSTKYVVPLAKHFELLHFDDHEMLYALGQRGETLFVVVSGRLRVQSADGEVSHAGPGQVFGDSVLRKGAGSGKRIETAVASGPIKVLGLGLHDYHLIMANAIREEQERTYNFLQRNMALASDWPEFKLRIFINMVHRQEYEKGFVLWRQGDDSKTLMILLQGTVSMERVLTVGTQNKWPVGAPAAAAANPHTLRHATAGSGGTMRVPPNQPNQSRPGLLGESDGAPAQPPPHAPPDVGGTKLPALPEAGRPLPQLQHDPDDAASLSVYSSSVPSSPQASHGPGGARRRKQGSARNMLVANTPRGMHHCRTSVHTFRHVQRAVRPGELFGEEALEQPPEYENDATPPRRHWAVVQSDTAVCLILNKRDAKRFFGLHAARCLDGLACYDTISDEEIIVQRRREKIARKLMIGALGPSYLKRSGMGRRWAGVPDL